MLLLDRAGWHTTSKLDVPDNITPIFLPSRAPELNPVENVWEFHARQLAVQPGSSSTADGICSTTACEAWNKSSESQAMGRIVSIGMREWAHKVLSGSGALVLPPSSAQFPPCGHGFPLRPVAALSRTNCHLELNTQRAGLFAATSHTYLRGVQMEYLK